MADCAHSYWVVPSSLAANAMPPFGPVTTWQNGHTWSIQFQCSFLSPLPDCPMSVPMLVVSLRIPMDSWSPDGTKLALSNHSSELVLHISNNYEQYTWISSTFYHLQAHAHIDTKRREPWLFSDRERNAMREAIIKRYTLLPYWFVIYCNLSKSIFIIRTNLLLNNRKF